MSTFREMMKRHHKWVDLDGVRCPMRPTADARFGITLAFLLLCGWHCGGELKLASAHTAVQWFELEYLLRKRYDSVEQIWGERNFKSKVISWWKDGLSSSRSMKGTKDEGTHVITQIYDIHFKLWKSLEPNRTQCLLMKPWNSARSHCHHHDWGLT